MCIRSGFIMLIRYETREVQGSGKNSQLWVHDPVIKIRQFNHSFTNFDKPIFHGEYWARLPGINAGLLRRRKLIIPRRLATTVLKWESINGIASNIYTNTDKRKTESKDVHKKSLLGEYSHAGTGEAWDVQGNQDGNYEFGWAVLGKSCRTCSKTVYCDRAQLQNYETTIQGHWKSTQVDLRKIINQNKGMSHPLVKS